MTVRDARIQAALIRDDELLVLEVHLDDGRHFWLLPGGGREPGDVDDAATVTREVREELSCEITADRLLLDRPAASDDASYRRYRTFLCRLRPAAEAIAGARDGIATIRAIRWLSLHDESEWGDEIVHDRFLYSQLQAIRGALADRMGRTP